MLTRRTLLAGLAAGLGCAQARPSRAQDGMFYTEVRVGVDRERVDATKITSAQGKQAANVLKERISILVSAAGAVDYQDLDHILLKVPTIDPIPPANLALLGRPGILELRHLENVQTQLEPKGRYVLDVLTIQGKEFVRQVRFRDRQTEERVPAVEFLKRCDLLAGNRDVVPGSAKAVTEESFMAVRLHLIEGAARRLERFSREPGRLLAVTLDGEILSVTTVNRRPKADKKERKREKDSPGEPKREAWEDYVQLHVTGGFRTEEEANALAVIFNSGPLPFPVRVLSTRLAGM